MSRALNYLLSVVAIGGVAYHMAAVIYPLQSSTEHLNTHLAFALVLVLLNALKNNVKQWPILVMLLLLSVAVTTYVKLFYWSIEARFGTLTTIDLVMAVILIVVVIESCRRAMGWALPAVTLIFLAYLFLGSYLPEGPLHIARIDPVEIVTMMTFQFGGTGIYGMLLEVSAYFVILFAIMGGVMQTSGAATFFRNLGIMVGRKLQGGPALMAVTGSALMGTVTGATTANIIVTGSFTIPLMKKVGYAPKEAAAIEAAASNGGQIMPPVMGAAAFVMSMITGIKYVSIIAAGFIPALLYFFSLGTYAQLVAKKRGIAPLSSLGERVNVRETLLSLPSFLVPLGTIIYLFLQGFSPMFVAFWAVIASVAVGIIRHRNRQPWGEWLQGMTNGIMAGATIAVSLATVGIIVKVLTITGLGIKLPSIVEVLSGGNIAIALILVMVTCIILGMGVPTTPAYILVSIVAAPILVDMGIGLLQAHFFVFYFAVMALLTPPVAAAAIVSSQLAGTTYMSTAIEAVKASVAGFLVPFIFVMNPIFLMQSSGGLLQAVIPLLSGLLMVVSVTIGFVGYYLTPLCFWERGLFLACTVVSFVYLVILHSYFIFVGALILFVLLTVSQLRRLRSQKVTM